MNKEEILKMSRQENEGRQDEREMAAYGEAGKVGMLVGGLLCAVLVFVSEVFLNNHVIGLVAWMVYFAMQGSHGITLYCKLKQRKHLFLGIFELVFSAAFLAALLFATLG